MTDRSAPLLELTYEPFSREPEYIGVNRAFVAALELQPCRRVADLASGTGAMTDLLLDALSDEDAGNGPAPAVYAFELGYDAIRLAETHLAERADGGRGRVRHIVASIDDLPVPAGMFDAVVIGNAIQLVTERDRLAREVRRALRPGGTFAFNTSFYAGAYLPGTERFYLRWVEEAVRYISRHRDSTTAGRPRRRKGAGGRAFSNRWLSADEYRELLERHGFVVRHTLVRTVELTRHSLETIGGYAGLASVLLSGYPVALACEALRNAAGPALEASGLDVVPRGWLEMSALSPGPAPSDGGHGDE